MVSTKQHVMDLVVAKDVVQKKPPSYQSQQQVARRDGRPLTSSPLLAKRRLSATRNDIISGEERAKALAKQSAEDIFRLAQNDLFGTTPSPTTRTTPGGRDVTPLRHFAGVQRLRTSHGERQTRRQSVNASHDQRTVPLEQLDVRQQTALFKRIRKENAPAPPRARPDGDLGSRENLREGHVTRAAGRKSATQTPEVRTSGIRNESRQQANPGMGKPHKQQLLNLAQNYASRNDVTDDVIGRPPDEGRAYDNPRYGIPAARGLLRRPSTPALVRVQQGQEHHHHQQQQYNNATSRTKPADQQQQQQQRQDVQTPSQLPVTIKDLAEATAGVRGSRTGHVTQRARLDVGAFQDLVGLPRYMTTYRPRIPRLGYVNYCSPEKTDLITKWLGQIDCSQIPDGVLSEPGSSHVTSDGSGY